MTDVVYVLGSGSFWADQELKFSLRSLELFLEDIGQVFVVGTRPRWLTNVVHLPWPDRHTCKERNIMEKLAYACGHPDLSQQFLHVHDDHFALAHQVAGEIPNWCGRSLAAVVQAVDPANHWRDAVLNTQRALEARGLTTFNYDIHLPMIFDKTLYPEVMDTFDWFNTPRGFVVKSLYGNTLKLTPTLSADLKLVKRETLQELVARLHGRAWFSLGNSALNLNLKNLLAALYPTPSQFELG
jgi:hypothetical protein